MRSIFTRNFVLFVSVLFFGTNLYSQTFSDDFESYSAGAYLGESSTKWTTWSKMPGTDEDVKITDEKALSGTKSIKFTSTASTGGPQDVVLPFGKKYTTGQFTLKLNFFIPSGKTGYFNVQGNTTVGSVWSLNVNFRNSGLMTVDDGSSIVVLSTFPTDTWFEFELDVNLTSNLWKVSMDSDCKGAFLNTTNAMASIDIYPSNALAEFYVDDVSYNYSTSATLFQYEAGVSALSWPHPKLAGEKNYLNVNVSNHGTKVITDLDLNIAHNGNVKNIHLTNLSVASKKTQAVTISEEFTLADGDNLFEVELAKINGTTLDLESCNNYVVANIKGYTAAPGRAVLVEEGTGTWCQFCPRGAVYMDRMSHLYPDNFIAIAVHNNDPMVNAEYDKFVTSTPGFTGFPSVVVNRSKIFDPSTVEIPFLERVSIPTPVTITPGAKFDSISRILDVSAEVLFNENISGDFYISLALTEDGVRGTTSGYNQVNAYAGNALGPMGGFESLPNPVPAAQMVYDHVARVLLYKDLEGDNYMEGPFTAGDKVLFNFQYEIPSGQNIDSFNIIPIVSSLDRGYENAASASIAKALQNGFLSSSKEYITLKGIEMYPNPAQETLNIELDLVETVPVSIEISDIAGTVVTQRNYGNLSGHLLFPIDVTQFNPGVYYSKIVAGKEVITKKFVSIK
ncbi:MAG: Omp28-related outer membrane protein [Saprospiraceae bacterium]|nr:Omp28-related outer membrane protein [Saprospiraceae bacterium]